MSTKMKPLFLAVACCLGSSLAMSATTASPPSAHARTSDSAPQAVLNSADSRERARLEELFIWRVSEELRLAPTEEMKFTEAIHSINQRRREANAKMDQAVRGLSGVKTRAEAEKALSAHRAALRETQAAANAELEKLKPLLGAQKLAQYLVVKNSILEKLKEMLASPASAQASSTTSSTTSPTASTATSPAAAHAASPTTALTAATPPASGGTASGMTEPAR